MILYFGVSVSENQVKHTKNVYGYKKKKSHRDTVFDRYKKAYGYKHKVSRLCLKLLTQSIWDLYFG